MSRPHPFMQFEQEILESVIAPKIGEIVRRCGDNIESRTSLLLLFNENHGTNITMATFSEWCEKLNIKFERKVVVSIPGYKPATREIQPVTQESADESIVAQFDEPKAMPDVPANFVAGERMVLPGGMRIPSYLENL
jgi:hypothetical protein